MAQRLPFIGWIVFIAFNAHLHAQSNTKQLEGEALLNRIALEIARVERHFSPPEIILERNTRRTARYVPGVRPRIYFSTKLYAICQSFEKDSIHAMAALLGHELAHHFERHKIMQSFAGVGERQVAATAEQVKLEAEADYLGLTLALFAGYTKAPSLLPSLIDKIYHTYQLPDKLQGYPPKKERIALVQRRMDELYPLRYTYLAGQILLLTGEHGYAASCFESVARQIKSREVVNNLGVSKLEWALSALPLHRRVYAYPFEVDPEGRIVKGALRTADQPDVPLHELLEGAASRFQEAILIDPSYESAYINLACTRVLQGNPNAAIGTINELARKLGEWNSDLPANALLIKAIALGEDMQYEKASAIFENAKVLGAFQADYNLQLFNLIKGNGKASYEQKDDVAFAHIFENWKSQYVQQQIGSTAYKFTPKEMRLGDWSFETLPEIETGEHILGKYPMLFYYHTQHDRELIKSTLKNRDMILLMTTPSFQGATSNGIKIGSWSKVVEEKYGKPDKVHAGVGGVDYWVYQMPGLIFQLQNQIVKGWIVYKYDFY